MKTVKNNKATNTPVNWRLYKTDPKKFWNTFGWVSAVVLLGVIWVMTRIMSVLPKILGDEYIYSINARHTPLAESTVPNYLFNLVFGTTSAFGYSFYVAAKFYNLIFLIGFAAVVYFTARLVAKPGISFFIAMLALVGPISAYASYFTPEMMFYFGCALVIYFALRFTPRTGMGKWAILGAGLGLVTLVKPHALFLAAPLFVYIIFLALKNRDDAVKWLKAPARAAAFVGAMFATKWAVGFAIAGDRGLGIFGGSYDNSATKAIEAGGKGVGESGADEAVKAIADTGFTGTVFWQVIFHITFMIMFLAVPLVLAGIQAFRGLRPKSELTDAAKVSFFLFVAVIALAAVSALFVAYSNSFGESLQNRVMIRYYEYILPFMPLVLVPLGNHIPKLGNVAKLLILAGVSAWALSVTIPGIGLMEKVPALFTDSALIASAIKSGLPLIVFVVAGLIMLTVWLFAPAKGAKTYLYYFAPAVVMFYAISSYVNMTVPSSTVGIYTESSRYAHNNLSDEDKKNILIVGTVTQTAKAAQLWLDEPTSQIRIYPEGSELDLDTVPDNVKYIVRVGKITTVGKGEIVKQSEYKLPDTDITGWALIKNQ